MVLWEQGVIDYQALSSIILEEGWSSDEIANLVQDVQRRSFIKEETARSLYQKIKVDRPILPFISRKQMVSPSCIDKAMEGEC